MFRAAVRSAPNCLLLAAPAVGDTGGLLALVAVALPDVLVGLVPAAVGSVAGTGSAGEQRPAVWVWRLAAGGAAQPLGDPVGSGGVEPKMLKKIK